MPHNFLKARWQHLCLFTYAVSPSLLDPFMPEGLTADTIEGNAFISLVAFDFLDTSVFGVKWPGFTNFPEINLRFYVRCNDERGVVFIREMVPQALVAVLARLFYNEPYISFPMKSSVTRADGRIEVEHSIGIRGKNYKINLTGQDSAFIPPESGPEHFFKEHRWGFGRNRSGKTIRYEVDHPVWEIYPVISEELDWDFATIYGDEFADLNSTQPYSVILAKGSEVAVYPLS